MRSLSHPSSVLQCLQQLGLGLAESMQVSPTGAGSKRLSCQLLAQGACWHEARLEVQQQAPDAGTRMWDAGFPGGDLSVPPSSCRSIFVKAVLGIPV